MKPEQVTIIMPTKGRRAHAATVLAAVSHRPFLVVVDECDPASVPPDLTGAKLVPVKPGSGIVKAVEAGIVAAATSHVACICDDVAFPDGYVWLAEACRVYTETIGDRDGVVALNDGIRSDIACFPLMSRKFYMEHMYPAPYRRYYMDTELSAKAQHLGVYAVATGARVTHLNIGAHDGAALDSEGQIFRARMADFSHRFSQMKHR